MQTTEKQFTLKNLPSPKGHFLLGHLPQFKASNKHQVLERWVEECGDLFKINFVGKEFIVSANPDINTQILKLRPDKFSRFYKLAEIFSEIGVLGVFNSEGDAWKRHRKPTAEALNLKKIKGFYPILFENTTKILTKWSHYANAQEEINVQKEAVHFTIDITTAIAFGYQLDTINNQENDFQKNLEMILPMINERMTALVPVWRFYKQQKDKDLDHSIESTSKLIYQFIEQAKKRLENQPELKENPSNFLEALLVEKEADGFTDEEIYSNVFTMLLAGEDTTSNSIAWTIYYLAQNPNLVEKVRQEALQVYENEAVCPTNEKLIQLKYADAVAQESIRLKPTTPQLYMQANEDMTIENLVIPKGIPVILQHKVAQTAEQYFSNATDFIPERWLKGGCPMHQNHSPNVMKAFGGGSRFCPGKYLAMQEMTILISALCKNYNFSLSVPSESIKEDFAFTMHPINLFVKLEKIN